MKLLFCISASSGGSRIINNYFDFLGYAMTSWLTVFLIEEKGISYLYTIVHFFRSPELR